MAKSVPAIFLDRDGTINVDHGYVHEIDNFEFIDGVIDAMRELKKMGFALVVVTNQSGIARGKFTEAQFETLTEWMDWSLADRDVDLDGIYYCPHHPQGSVEEFRQVCDCRKPHPGMLLSARDYLHIDMAASYMVGDKLEDMQAAVAVAMNHYCRSRYDLMAILKTLGAGRAQLRKLIVGQWLMVLALSAVTGGAIGLLFENVLMVLLKPFCLPHYRQPASGRGCGRSAP